MKEGIPYRRGATCEQCGYWSPFMRSFLPSSIEHSIFIADPMDVQEWNPELYAELLVRDCVEMDGLVYFWTKNRQYVKRASPELLEQRMIVRYDSPKKPFRQKRLSWMSQKSKVMMSLG